MVWRGGRWQRQAARQPFLARPQMRQNNTPSLTVAAVRRPRMRACQAGTLEAWPLRVRVRVRVARARPGTAIRPARVFFSLLVALCCVNRHTYSYTRSHCFRDPSPCSLLPRTPDKKKARPQTWRAGAPPPARPLSCCARAWGAWAAAAPRRPAPPPALPPGRPARLPPAPAWLVRFFFLRRASSTQCGRDGGGGRPRTSPAVQSWPEDGALACLLGGWIAAPACASRRPRRGTGRVLEGRPPARAPKNTHRLPRSGGPQPLRVPLPLTHPASPPPPPLCAPALPGLPSGSVAALRPAVGGARSIAVEALQPSDK